MAKNIFIILIGVFFFVSNAEANSYTVEESMAIQGVNARGETVTPFLSNGDTFVVVSSPDSCKSGKKSCAWGKLVLVTQSSSAPVGSCFCTSESNIAKQKAESRDTQSSLRFARARSIKRHGVTPPVLVKPNLQGHGSSENLGIRADAESTKFPLKNFQNLFRLEDNGALGIGQNYENLFIMPEKRVQYGNKTYAVGKVYSGSEAINDNLYMIDIAEFEAIKKKSGWKQDLPEQQYTKKELEQAVPGIDAEAFSQGAIPLNGKGWTLFSNKGIAKGTDSFFFKPGSPSKDGNYVEGTLHRKNADGRLEKSPAFSRRYALSKDNVGHDVARANGHGVPADLAPIDYSNVTANLGPPTGFRQKMIDCAEKTPGKLGTTGYCADGVQETMKCALGKHPGNGHAYQMISVLTQNGFTKMPNVTDPTQTPDGCVNTYDSYANPGTYSSKPSRTNPIPGFPKPSKYSNWVPYYGHIEVKVSGGAISDFKQKSTGLSGGKSTGIASISPNRYYKFTGAYCKL